jgi:putative colanic acid biosynthesis acetyltransferase WcaF
VGEKVVIKPGVNIKYPWFLTIGNHCWIGENVWIDNLAAVKIGNHVCISQGALLLTGNHDYKKTDFKLITGEIILEDGVWIGANAMVCPAVTLASHAVLAAGSVATSNLAAYGIYQGNPAVKKKERILN